MSDLEINNATDFYKNVRLDSSGGLITTSETSIGEQTKAGNAYNFFKRIALDSNGQLKTTGYTPDRTILEGIFNDYNFTNMWSSENLLISGTDTTLLDYSGEHDLVNPASNNQPTLNVVDPEFNGKPFLTYDGVDDFSYKSVPNWRGSDSNGVMIGVYKTISGVYSTFLMTGDESSNNYFAYNQLQANNLRFAIKSVSTNAITTDNNINDSLPHVVSYSSNGSSYQGIVDGVTGTNTVLAGSDNGDWLGNSPTQRDNILIGGFKSSSSLFANINWVMSGYLPFVSEANIIALQEELKTYYNI